MHRRRKWILSLSAVLTAAFIVAYLDGAVPEETHVGRVLEVRTVPGGYTKGSLNGLSPNHSIAVVRVEGQEFVVRTYGGVGNQVTLRVKRGRFTGWLYVLGPQ